jgi:hypothetical protein
MTHPSTTLSWVFRLFNEQKRLFDLDFNPIEAYENLVSIKAGEMEFTCDCHLTQRCNCRGDIYMADEPARVETRRKIYRQELIVPTAASLMTMPKSHDHELPHAIDCWSRDPIESHYRACPNRHDYDSYSFTVSYIEHILNFTPNLLDLRPKGEGEILISSILNNN